MRSVRRAIRDLLKLETQAEIFGSEGAIIIMTDIKSGLDMYKNSPFKVLTDRQKEAILLCLIQDKTEAMAAEELGVSQQAINSSVNSGVKKIRDYLITGDMGDPVFTPEENRELLVMYMHGKKPMDIARLLNKSPRTIRNKIKYLKAKGKIGGGENRKSAL
jgi:predicted DNA-binding protein (UPF0251 family)